MSVERDVAEIADRDALHRAISELPSGAQAILLVRTGPVESDEPAGYQFHYLGNPSVAEAHFMASAFAKCCLAFEASEDEQREQQSA